MYKHIILPNTQWDSTGSVMFPSFFAQVFFAVCPFARWDPGSKPKCHARKNIPRQELFTATGRCVRVCKGGKDKEKCVGKAQNFNVNIIARLGQLVFELFDASEAGCSGEELAPRKARSKCWKMEGGCETNTKFWKIPTVTFARCHVAS